MLRDSPVLALTLGSLKIVCVIVSPLGASPDRMRHKLVGRFGRSNGDKRHAATEILASNHRLGWCEHRHAGVAALRVDYRKSGGKQRDSGSKTGRKISAQVFHFFMCLRMVSALRPSAISPLAICCEYHTSDIFGRRFFNSRYAFRQRSCLA